MKSFCNKFSLKSLIRQPICYKNLEKPTCKGLVLTNMPRSCVYIHYMCHKTGLSDFHLITLSVMRKSFKKIKPRIINYRSYYNFSNEYYRKYLLNELKRETFVINDRGFENFCENHALIKNKYTEKNLLHLFQQKVKPIIMQI